MKTQPLWFSFITLHSALSLPEGAIVGTSRRAETFRLLRLQERAIEPALILRVRVGGRASVLRDLHLIPLAVHLQALHARAVLGQAHPVVARVRAAAQVYIRRRHKLTPAEEKAA